ncbi:unnamed protein product [Ambrosiozyma monospora]|uniref:Unnamed protein product n=1 Tax=Ambrosiozyma monospora TaxID=43982 RepID=A0ACB5T9N9_AMBMO|nr:unnamed protein product [Ambrosiozyma monospora]
MMSSPPEDAGFPPLKERREILNALNDELRTSREMILQDYSSGYGNLTGFKLSYDDAKSGKNASNWPFPEKSGLRFIEDEKFSILPNDVSSLAKQIWNTEETVVGANELKDSSKKHHDGVYWYNITGSVRGEFTQAEERFTEISMPLPHHFKKYAEYRDSNNQIDFGDPTQDSSSEQRAAELEFPIVKDGNITYSSGLVKMEILNRNETSKSKDSTYVNLNLYLNNKKQNDDHTINLIGVYHQSTGNLVGVTRSAKFAGIYALPQLNLEDGRFYNQTQELLNVTTNVKQEVEFGRVEELLDESQKCEFITYMHFESTDLTQEDMKRIDTELSTPLGRPTKDTPALNITGGLVYSPDCGLLLNITPSDGSRKEVHSNQLRNAIIFAVGLFLIQVALFIRQMNATNTPSTLSRIAFWTVAIINLVDGSLCMTALLCSMIFKNIYIQFAVLAFLAFICSSIYEMRYMIQIYLSQMNERTITWRTALQGTPIEERQEQQNQENQQNQEQGLPAPVTTPTPAAAPEDEQSVSASLYTRSFFGAIVFLFFLLNVLLWPRAQRTFFEYSICIIFNSYWIPQIYRNVIRGSRKSFTWEFILGTSIVRLVPIIVISLFDNPFHHRKDTRLVWLLTTLLVVQLIMLYLQELLGPRFFLPEKYLPKTYDYHPVLTTSDLESGYLDDEDRNIVNHKCKVDCAICMQQFEVPIVDTSMASNNDGTSDEGSSSSPLLASVNIIARRNYMVTPCKHIFHTDCLENWMKYKLQCPVCRNTLPPL